MKKGILIGGILLVLAALAWFGGRKLFGPKGADATAESVELSGQDDVSSNDADTVEIENSGITVSGAEADSSAAEADDAARQESNGGDIAVEKEMQDAPEETAAPSEASTLYTIKTSTGTNLGMVPVVNGNAVVLMDGGGGTTYQGEYTPAEQGALQSKVEEQTALAASDGKIGEWAFYREAGMKEFMFPDGVAAIGRFAFARSGLSGIVIPEGVTSIGAGAFYHCDSLTDVAIPESVTVIEENAFAHTPWLKNWMAGGSSEDTEDFLIVGDGILLAYRGSESEPEIPPQVKSIVPGALGE